MSSLYRSPSRYLVDLDPNLGLGRFREQMEKDGVERVDVLPVVLSWFAYPTDPLSSLNSLSVRVTDRVSSVSHLRPNFIVTILPTLRWVTERERGSEVRGRTGNNAWGSASGTTERGATPGGTRSTTSRRTRTCRSIPRYPYPSGPPSPRTRSSGLRWESSPRGPGR